MDPLELNIIFEGLVIPKLASQAEESDLQDPQKEASKKLGHVILDQQQKSKNEKIKKAQPMVSNPLENRIKKTVKDLNIVKSKVNELEKHAETFNNFEETHELLEDWILDFVLKRGTFALKSGLPLLLDELEKTETLEHFDPTIDNVKTVLEFFEIGFGVGAIVYKEKLINTALKKLKELSEIELQPEEAQRVKELTVALNLQAKRLSAQVSSQGIKASRNALSITRVGLSLASNPIVTTISTGLNLIIGGINLFLTAAGFIHARNNLRAHSKWSNKLQKSINTHLKIDKTTIEKNGQEIAPAIQTLLSKRKIQREKNKEILAQKIQDGSLKWETVQDKIAKVKQDGLEQYLNKVDIKNISKEKLVAELTEKLGDSLDETLVKDLLLLKEIISSKNLLPVKKRRAIIDLKYRINEKSKSCVENWVKTQSHDSLVDAYIDYQSVMDMTLKNSLAEMLVAKHKIENGFLSLKKKTLSVSLTMSTILLGATITFTVIGLVANPIGAGGLILFLLGATSMALGIGMAWAGYYYAYKKKPEMTSALFKGTYLKLYGSYLMNKIHSIKEDIGSYLKNAWIAKKGQEASYVGRTSILSTTDSRPNRVFHNIVEKKPFVEKAGEQLHQIQKKSEIWKNKITVLERNLAAKGWKDFAGEASLTIGERTKDFDTLNALTSAIIESDLNLLSEETKQLLKEQMGIDVSSLQQEVDKEPAVKKAILSFFNLEEPGIMRFIENQKALKSFGRGLQ